LANHPGIKTLHIISHGAPGCLFLGNTQLNLETLERYTTQLKSWFKVPLTKGDLGGSLLLYGCNVAARDAGEEFLNKLHNITQANIAASRNLTGNPQQGGNWDLDFIIGDIEAELAFNTETQTTYAGILADPVAADDNLGAAGTTSLPVLVNDTDADGDRLQIASIDTAPSHGTATINDWIYAIGSTYEANPSGGGTLYDGMVRFNGDGSRDTHFNVNANGAQDIVLDQSGQPVISGIFTTVNGTARNKIAHLNSNGLLNISFDPGAGMNNNINAIAVDENGKIVVGGDFTSVDGTARNRIARLNADGSLDTSFDPGAGMDDDVNAIAIDENGKIVVGGSFTSVDGTVLNAIARLNSDGSLDTSFDPGPGMSYEVAPGYPVYGTVNAIDFDSSGNIVVGGNFSQVDGTARENIARLNTDGSLDTSFDPGADSGIYSIAVDENDKIVIGGMFSNVDGTARNYIARLNTDGSLDTSFDPGTGISSLVYSVAIDENDGKIVAGGQFTSVDGTARNYIARLNTDGTLDTSFDPGTILLPSGSRNIAVSPQSNILYTPDAGFNGIDTLTYTIVDPDSNTSSPATLEILVNNSPVITGSRAFLNNQDQDDSNSSGTLVSTIDPYVTDADAGAAQGIAITSFDTTNGSWQYTTDGTNWTDAPTVSETNALLLASDTNTAIRFVPNAGYSGILTKAIEFAAWDQLTGNNGDTADYTTDRYQKNNASPFSSKIVPGGLTVQPPPPTVVRVYADPTEDGVRVVGDIIFIKVEFSEPVTYSTPGTAPGLRLETGATDVTASYNTGSGTDTLTFYYSVRTTDVVSPDLDYLSTTALYGSIKNTALTADAVLTLPEPGMANSLSANNDIIVGVSNSEIQVTQGTTDIADDTTTAFDFGTTPVGTPVTQTFTIQNVGTDDLTLTNPISLTGTGFELLSSNFTDTTLASGASTSFDVTLQATNVGTVSGNLSFANNDSDENPFNFPVTGTVVEAIPEIEVTQGTTVIVDDTTTAIDFGSTTVGTPISKVFNIKNIGTDDLTLTNPISLTGTGFELLSSTFTDTTLAPGEVTSFRLTLAATELGAASGTLSFANNDDDENPFNFPISGIVTEVPVPEIEVTQGTTDIPDGEVNPAFDFGTTPLYTPVTKTFTVKNTGTADLTLINPIEISGMGFDLVSSTFADTSLAPGESTTFDVTLQASEATSQGLNNGVISFINDDSDEGLFDFKVEGFVDGAGFGDIEVIHGTTNITDGTTTPIDLGSINWGESALKTFTVKNTGVSNLILTNPITITGDGFELQRENFTKTTLTPGDSTNFTVKFNTIQVTDSNGAIATGNISITSNDGDESLFNFPIQGKVNAPPVPEIEVFEGTTEIQDGTTTPIDFGSFPAGKPFIKTFTVKNTGIADLRVDPISLTLPPGIQMISSLFEDGNTWGTVAPGASTTFDITLVATAAGAFTGELSFENNDSDADFNPEGVENPFNFPIQGFVSAPEIAVKDGSLDIADGTATAVDWDEVRLTHQITKTFTIENSGDADLELSDLSLTGNGLKLVSSTFADTTVAPGQSTTVDVTIEGTVEGTATGTFSLANNDLDESDFDFPIQVEVTEPEIEVSALGTAVIDGIRVIRSSTPYIPSIEDDTKTPINFAEADTFRDPVTQKFVVKNTGTGHLSLTNPINLTGTGFELVSSHFDKTDLAPGESTGFEVKLTAKGGGDYNGAISLESNDRDEAVFNFPIAGKRIGPNIEIVQETTPISHDTTKPIDFGTGLTLGEAITKTFTIKNTGTADLFLPEITLNQTIKNDDLSKSFGDRNLYSQLVENTFTAFELNVPDILYIPAGQSTTFDVVFSSEWEGDYTGDISVTPNYNLDAFQIPIQGRIDGPEIEVKLGTQDIEHGQKFYLGSQTHSLTNPGVNYTFTITNTGKGYLKLFDQPQLKDPYDEAASDSNVKNDVEAYKLGRVFNIEENYSKTILAPGESTTFAVFSDIHTIKGTPHAFISLDTDENRQLFATNDSDEVVDFRFAIYGDVFSFGPEIRIDDNGGEILFDSGYIKEYQTTLVGIPITEKIWTYNRGDENLKLYVENQDRSVDYPKVIGTGFELSSNSNIGWVTPSTWGSDGEKLYEVDSRGYSSYTTVETEPSEFDITLDAKEAGTHTATVSMPSNDSDENPFTFQVEGVVENLKPDQIADGIDRALNGLDEIFENSLEVHDIPFTGKQLESLDYDLNGIETIKDKIVTALLQETDLQAPQLGAVLQKALGNKFKVTSELSREGVKCYIKGTVTQNFIDAPAILSDLGLPGLGLTTNANGKVNADFKYNINLGFGYKPVEGFYFDTETTSIDLRSNISFGIDQLPVVSVPFNQFPIEIKDSKITTGNVLVPNQMILDMKDVGQDANQDGKLTPEEIKSVSSNTQLFDYQDQYKYSADPSTPQLTVTAETDLPDNAPIPSYTFDLIADYGSDSSQKPEIYFENMQANFGPFITNFLKPVMNAINEVIDPVRPIIDFFNRRITPLETFSPVRDYFDDNDNDQVNLLEVAKKLSKGGNYSSIIAFMDALIKLDDISDSLNNSISRLKNHPDMLATDLGSYSLNFDARNGSTKLDQAPIQLIGSKPASPLEQIVEAHPDELITEILLTLKSLESSALKAIGKSLIPDHVWSALEYTVSQVDLEKITKDYGLPDLPELKGMDIPILYETDKAVELLTGEIENLFTYKLPTLDFKFDSEFKKKLKEIKEPISQKVIATINGLIPFGIGVKTNLGFGFDTQGLTDWQEGGFKADETDTFMNGFYISDRLNADGTGPDVNELKLYGSIGVGMEADLKVVSGQIRGTIDAYPNFDLIDVGENAKNKTDGDGKVHIFSELLPRMGDAIEMNGSVYASLTAVIKALGFKVYDEKIATYKIADFTYGSTSHKRSRAIDGYLAGSDAFFDANLNGIKDEDEPRTRTNADGSFELTISLDKYDLNSNGEIDWSEGKIIIENGFDIATLLPLTSPLSSIPEATVVTPLTTLISSLVDLGIDPQTAESMVKASLNLPADVDLNTFDPLEAITLDNANGLPVFGSMIAVQNTIVQIAELIDGVSELPRHQITGVTVTAIARQIQDQPSVDLTQLATVTTIIQAAITEIAVDEPNINQAQLNTVTAAAAQVISQGNNLIQEILESGISPQEAALQITRLQAVAVGQVTVGLSDLASGTQSVEEFLAANTVAQIKQRAAEVEVNDPTIRPTVEEVVPELDWSTFYESLAELNIPSSFTEEPVDEPNEPTDETDESVDEPTDNSAEEPTDEGSQPQSSLIPPQIPELQTPSVETSSSLATEENVYDPTLSIPVITQPVQPPNAAAEVISNSSSNGEPTPNADVILGDGTDNLIHALAGDDIVSMGDGNDWMSANQGNDIVDGEKGNDTVHGGKDNDTIFGSADNDWMNGNKGSDFLDGGEAMDTLYGGEDSDTLQGNAGDDWLSGNKGADFLDGGAGVDTLFGGQDSDTLQGGADNDELCGNVGADLLEGNDGNDLLYGGQDHDTVSGNNGDDIIYGDRGNDLLDGNVANDIVNGGEGNDTLDGGEGDDQLFGDAGDDVLFGAGGNDTLTGGEGQDQFILTPGSGSNLITDFTDGEDVIVLEDGLTFEQLMIETSENATIVKLNEEILATLNGVESGLITADDFVHSL
jgi:uncharacterized delta-60 repeat protein